MANIAFVPTRMGSQRFPGKNVAVFLGERLIDRTLRQAAESEAVDRIISLSDDPEIHEASLRAGAEFMWLPSHLTRSDVNPTRGVIHAVSNLPDVTDEDCVALLHVSNPLREVEDIDRCFERLAAGFDSALTVTRRVGNFFGTMDADGTYHPRWCVENPPSTQDLEATYCLNGGVYATHARRLVESGTWLSGRVAGVEIPRYRMDDINTPEDLVWCEVVAEAIGRLPATTQ